MSLLDVSPAYTRGVPTRPVMEGVLVSSEGETPGVASACRRAAFPPAHRRKDTAPSRLCSCRVRRWHDPRWGEEWQGLGARHGLAVVACA
jgi:hypothetical protein